MAIYRLIANGSFEPEEIEVMTAAYEAALSDLRLVDRDDPITEIVARAIVSITGLGERDPVRLKERALHALGAGDDAMWPQGDEPPRALRNSIAVTPQRGLAGRAEQK